MLQIILRRAFAESFSKKSFKICLDLSIYPILFGLIQIFKYIFDFSDGNQFWMSNYQDIKIFENYHIYIYSHIEKENQE